MKERVKNRILNSSQFRKLLQLLAGIRLRNGKVSLLRILMIFVRKVQDDEVFDRAYGVAFNLTLSVFPALIFLVSLLPYLPFIHEGQIMAFLQELMPASVYKTADATIRDILSRPRSGLLSFGVVFALYLATNGMISLMNAFNRIFQTLEKRSFLKTRTIATSLTLILSFMLLASVLMLVVGQLAIKWLYVRNSILEDYQFYLFISLRFLSMFVGFLLTISAIYYLAPSIHKRWQFFSIGSILAALLCLAVSFLFSAYITNFGTYNKLYGSIGALIALMIWLYMLAVSILIGFTLNASIDTAFFRLALKERRSRPMQVAGMEPDHS